MAETRILVAEDNELTASTLETQLQALGYDVVGVARNGHDVARMCDKLQPDLLVIDIHLPDLRPEFVNGGIPFPIVLITAQFDTESIRQAEQVGALAYLIKPVSPEELPPAIDVALARHRELDHLRTHVHELRDSMEARKLLERAKGILMKRLNISDREAEERIRQRAKDKQVDIKDIAQAIVESDALLS